MDCISTKRSGFNFIVVQKQTPGKVFNASINIKVGSANEPEDLGGISHYLEHAVFLGSKSHTSREKMENHLLSFGGEYNAFTGVNHTGYLLSAPLDKLERGIETLCDLALQPNLNDEKELKKEKKVVTAELEQDLTEDGEWEDQSQVAYEKLFAGHPLSRSIAGTKKTLKNITPYALKGYHNLWYSDPSRICFTIVSPDKPERTLERVLGNVFGAEGDHKVDDLDLTVPKLPPLHEVAAIKTASFMWEIDFFYHFEHKLCSKDITTFNLLNLILFHSEASYVYGAARKKGLMYSADGSYSNTLGANVFRVSTKVSREKMNPFCTLFHKQIRKIIKHGIDPQFLANCKSYYFYLLQLALENGDRYAYRRMNVDFLKEQTNMPEVDVVNLEKIKEADVIEALKIIFVADRRVLTIKGPDATAEMADEIRDTTYLL